MIKRKLLVDRKIRTIETGEIICSQDVKFPLFILLSGKLKIGDYLQSRLYSLYCVECLYGIGSMYQISAQETSKILVLGTVKKIPDVSFF